MSTAVIAEDPSALGNDEFYRGLDDRRIVLITTYRHERDAGCTVLDVPPAKDRIAEAAAAVTAEIIGSAPVGRGVSPGR